MRVKFILALLLSLGIYHSAWAQPNALQNNVLDASWNKPVPVIKDPSAQVPLFNITLAETNRGIYTFGTPLPDPDYYSMAVGQNVYKGKERLIAINPHRKRMPVPDGDFTFAYPQAVAGSAGSIHLLWAEPDSSNQNMSRYQTVWYARYAGGIWSDPTAVYRSESLNWNNNSKSNLMVDANKVLHIMFVADKKKPSGTTVGFTHLYKNKSGWHSNFSPDKRALACKYLDMANTNNGKLYMTCTGTDFESKGDFNNVFFSSSTNNGQSWSTPELVSRSGKKEAHFTKLLTNSDGTLHLVWAKSLDTNFTPETIWHSQSQDGGKTWSTPLDLNTDQPITSYEIIADSSDRFHLVYEAAGRTQYSTHYKMWTGDHWEADTDPLLPGTNTQVVSPILITRNNRLRFVLSILESVQPPLPDHSVYLEKKLKQ